MTPRETITCDDLDKAIDRFKADGYRLDMIMPADDPREAQMSNGGGESVRLTKSSKFKVQSSKSPTNSDFEPGTINFEPASGSEWIVGRAGMLYRDLIPDRLGGRVIASHIRIVNGGEVADRVHYHKIDFQIIYCIKGAIRLVYEDQGEPFWLKPGDLVLQPPQIRHRVLEAEAGSEVIEVTSPAEHETWFDHDLDLPKVSENPARMFSDQRFVRHTADISGETTTCRTEIMHATNGKYDVYTYQTNASSELVSVDKDNSLDTAIGGYGLIVVLNPGSEMRSRT